MKPMKTTQQGEFSKVPEVTLIFWTIKILATTLGETAGDAVSMSLNLGYLLSTVIFAVIFLAGVSVASAQVSIGIRIGSPPPPRVVHVLPARPGPEFVWVEGYWYPVGHHYKWHEGYWTRPPYEGARWVAPHHDGQQYYAGYWDGNRGHVEHDHLWDHQPARDFRDQGQYHDQGHDGDNRDPGRN